MKKNVAGQKIGAQMVSATDGSAFTSSVTCYVCIDAGSQGAGSVGSGACTHEGNGYHTYAPADSETNGDLLAFTFVGTGAVPATVQVFTSYPQTGDSFARLGAPAGASVSADIAALPTAAEVNAEVVDVLRTDTIPDSYAADGDQPTIAQAILAIQQYLFERSLSGTTVTVKKPNGSTTAMTFTLDDATSPTSITRAT